MFFEKRVNSSAIQKVGYNSKTKMLTITFNNGRGYDYPEVPRKEVMDFVRADSIGRYYNQHIKKYSVNQK